MLNKVARRWNSLQNNIQFMINGNSFYPKKCLYILLKTEKSNTLKACKKSVIFKISCIHI